MRFVLRDVPFPNGVTVTVFRAEDVGEDGRFLAGKAVASGIVGDSLRRPSQRVSFPSKHPTADYGLEPGVDYVVTGSGGQVAFTTPEVEDGYWAEDDE